MSSPQAVLCSPTYNLVKSFNPKKIYINFIIEISALNGRKTLPADVDVTSLITY